MARANKFWRTLTVLGAAVLALSLASAAFAQAPPSPPHQFFGSAADGSGATVDGEDAADGAVVVAWNEAGENVGEGTIDGGLWLIQVASEDASSVTFTVDGNATAGSFDVESGSLTSVTLVATSGGGGGGGDTPGSLPNTGTGGLADSGSGLPVLPLVLALTVVVALGGAAATRRSRSLS